MMKALIIDDEAAARNALSSLLRGHCPELQVVEMAVDVPSAVKAIHKYQPGIIFLDVEMPGQNGFQLLDYFEAPDFEIIFTTAYSEYALKAFEVSAIDYLLKPLQISKLKIAVDKAIRSTRHTGIKERVNILKETLEVNHIQKIALPVAGGLSFVKVDDILYLQAEGSYTYVVTLEGKKLISKKIKEFEDILNEDIRFFRIHRSYILNAKYIKEYIKHDGTCVLTENQDSLPVARERKQAFEEWIKKLRIEPSSKRGRA